MARRNRNDKEIVVDYRCASDICAAATADYGDHNAEGMKYWREYMAHDWMGLVGFAKDDEASVSATIRAIRDGWPKGAELIRNLSESIETPTAQSIRRRCVWMDNGDELSMDKVYSGNLDTAWRKPAKRIMSGPSKVRIVVDSIASGSVDAETMAWRGVAAAKLADVLTAAGYAVEVVSAFDGSGRAGMFRISCVVKPFEAPVDIQTLAATTALPAFFRAIGHIMQPIHAPNGQDPCGGYGVCILDTERFIEDGVVLFAAKQSIRNKEDAERWINESIAALEEQYLEAA